MKNIISIKICKVHGVVRYLQVFNRQIIAENAISLVEVANSKVRMLKQCIITMCNLMFKMQKMVFIRTSIG